MSSGSQSDDPTTELTGWAPARASDVDATHVSETGPRQLLAARYELCGLLGQGGMGAVYKARDLELDETVALKMLRPDTPIGTRALERFRREVKLARRVTHRNVARTFDISEHEGTKFLTMELIEGEPLSAILAREGKLAPQRATYIAAEVCGGLSAAHAAGVVHRDLKPDNVMLEQSGRVVITDFGIAHAAAGEAFGTLGGTVGTPAYMAPEQVEGRAEIDGRADIYALGVMLFEMLTGRMPFDGGSPIAMATARLSTPPPNPRAFDAELPEWLADVVVGCLAVRPEDRFHSAERLARMLRSSVATLPQSNLEPIPDSRQPRAPHAALQPTAPGQKTVAVLPFKNAGVADDAYLAEGLTEDLIDTLSTTPGLKVRPRGMVEGLASGSADPRQLGARLGVQVVVEGTLRRHADKVRVAARVVSVRDGFQLWAKRFDRPAADLLVVSDEVAQSIAEVLTVGLQAQGRQAATDPRATDLYLRGRAELARQWELPMQRAVELLEQAHRLAPGDVTILASYARARARRWYFEGGAEEGRAARELAQQAIAKAPERGEAWLALAQVRFVENDNVSAARLLKTALAKSPLLAEAHELHGELLVEVGDLNDAIACMDGALSLDPTLRTRITIARALAMQGRWDHAARRLQVPPEDEQAQIGGIAARARLALWRGQNEVFTPELSPELPELLPTHYARIAEKALSRRALEPSELEFVEEHLSRVHDAARFAAFKRQLAAEIFCAIGEQARAQVAIHEAVDLGLVDENWLRDCPLLAALRPTQPFERARAVVVERAARVRQALVEP